MAVKAWVEIKIKPDCVQEFHDLFLSPGGIDQAIAFDGWNSSDVLQKTDDETYFCEYITAESQEIHEACIAQLTSNEELMEQINNLTDSFKITYFNRLFSIAC